jgi:hypothetical protein
VCTEGEQMERCDDAALCVHILTLTASLLTVHLPTYRFENNSELKQNVWPDISTDDITCSLCQGISVTVSCHLIFIPKFHTKTCSTNRGSETDNVLSKKTVDGTNARPQQVWTLMVGTTRPFCKTSSNITTYFR